MLSPTQLAAREGDMSKLKMRHCFCCGEELGCYVGYEPLDTCGKSECEREARYARLIERDEAHEQLDKDRGWT